MPPKDIRVLAGVTYKAFRYARTNPAEIIKKWRALRDLNTGSTGPEPVALSILDHRPDDVAFDASSVFYKELCYLPETYAHQGIEL